ncbi:MAG: hypothetical protein J0H06_04140, partial [Actinobacteria bacterium]|nr:hypothetical protein [Actinomycetota bacterium]
GQASMAVASLEARLDGRPIAVELVPIPAELVDRFHFGRRFRFFIVFMHGDQGGGTLSITARDAGGKVLARRKFEMYGIFRLSR